MPTATLPSPSADHAAPELAAATDVGPRPVPPAVAPQSLDTLAHAIAEDGIDAHGPAVAALVAAARAAGVRTASLDTLADPGRPAVLRTRAFAHVARRVPWS